MMISPIHKKGNRLLRSNYRAISLLSIAGKVFLRILLESMKVKIENRLHEMKANLVFDREEALSTQFSLCAK